MRDRHRRRTPSAVHDSSDNDQSCPGPYRGSTYVTSLRAGDVLASNFRTTFAILPSEAENELVHDPPKLETEKKDGYSVSTLKYSDHTF